MSPGNQQCTVQGTQEPTKAPTGPQQGRKFLGAQELFICFQEIRNLVKISGTLQQLWVVGFFKKKNFRKSGTC